MSASLLEVSGWKDRTGKVWRLLEDVPHSEVPAATPLYSQATVDTLRAQLEAAHAEVARLAEIETVNEMFRTFVIGEGAYERFCALQARAEAAEADAARYRWLQKQTPYCFKKIQYKAAPNRDDDVVYFFKEVFDAEIDARTKEETK